MEYLSLGKTNLKISKLGVGAIPLQRFDVENAFDILKAAYESGVNFIDTARAYTTSEEFLGFALKEIGREKFVLATKSMKRDYKGMKEDIEISLKNLQTNYIDLYQVHYLNTQADFEKIFCEDGAYKALLEAKANGKIGHIGVSSHTKDAAIMAIKSEKFETIQYAYNHIESDNEEILKLAKKYDMGTIIMKPVCGGATMYVDLVLRFIASNKLCDTLIPGVDDAKQLTENAKVFKGFVKPLNEKEMDILIKEKEEIGTEFCRKCDYCMPCPEGIKIPGTFLNINYYERYNLKEWAVEKHQPYPIFEETCTDCGLCESKCPYNLPIRKMLKEAEKVLRK